MPGTIFAGGGVSRIDKGYRTNEVVFLDDIYRGAPERSDILRILKRKIWTDECRALWHEGGYIFDIINYSTWQEAVVSRYGDGDFYKKHQDTRFDHITYRLVTMVYYVSKNGASFRGGALRLWEKEESLEIEPRHNRAVLFPSFTLHGVETVRLETAVWDDARFSINYWMGFR
jgi:hypothetical protein